MSLLFNEVMTFFGIKDLPKTVIKKHISPKELLARDAHKSPKALSFNSFTIYARCQTPLARCL